MKIKIINDAGMIWAVTIVQLGDSYGLNNCMVHDQEDPLIEFYDCRYEHTEYGQFVSRYYASTLLETDEWKVDLNLYGGVEEWGISAAGMNRIMKWVKEATGEDIRQATSPVLLGLLNDIEMTLAGHPQVTTGSSKVHYCFHKTRAAIAAVKGE